MVFPLRSVGRYAGLAACLFLFVPIGVFAQTAGHSSAPQKLLPGHFSGWVEQGEPKAGTAPSALDPSNAEVLSEYGLKDFATGAYHHGGAEASVHAMRFVDATGAYGAFTFYRKPSMNAAAIGNGGARNAHEAVFWSGTTVVDAIFSGSQGPSAASLKALAKALPPASGRFGVQPSLPQYLPAKSLDQSTVRYAIGPAAYARSGGVLPANAIDFSRDAETVTAQYAASGGRGTLTLIDYPTPQMAASAEKSIASLLKGPLPVGLQQSSPAALGVRRSGPIVSVTSGHFSSAEAQKLLGQVKYQAQVTWSHPHDSVSEVKKAAEMLMGIATLTGILVAFALLLATFLGGGRALWRVMRGKPASSVYEEDFISLNLSGWGPGTPRKLP
jgi:hypothetical protein